MSAIKLGVPSKGRLMEKTFDWFAERSATPMLTETPSRPRGDAIVVFATARRSRSAIAIA